MNNNFVISKIDISSVLPNHDNPRKDLGDLTELVESIKKNGIMQNLTVIPKDDSLEQFIVLIGNRRLAAAKLAGVSTVPCRIILNNIPDKREQMAIMLEENMQRNDLTIVEQAQGFQMMLNLGYTPEQIARRTGFSSATIYHRINIAKLDKDVLEQKLTGLQLTITDLYNLERIEDETVRNEILRASTSKEMLRWKIDQTIEDIRKKKILDKMRDYVIRKGIKQLPADMASKLWSYNSKTVYQLKEGQEWSFEKPKDDTDIYFYVKTLGSPTIDIMIVKKKEEVKEDKKSKEIDENREKIQGIMDGVDEKLYQFANYLLYKNKSMIKDDKVTEEMLGYILKKGILSKNNLVKAIDKKDYLLADSGRMDKISDDAADSSMMCAIVICMIGDAMFRKVADWGATYSKGNADIYMKVIDIIDNYGFELTKEEREVLEGSSYLYMEKKNG